MKLTNLPMYLIFSDHPGPLERRTEGTGHLLALPAVDGISGYDHEIVAGAALLGEGPVRLAHQPSGPVAAHAVPHLLAGEEGCSVVRQTVLPVEEYHVSVTDGLTFIIKGVEVGFFSQYIRP